VHAVAETRDNQLVFGGAVRQAAGGCFRAASGADEQQAMQDIGHIKLRLMQPFARGSHGSAAHDPASQFKRHADESSHPL